MSPKIGNLKKTFDPLVNYVVYIWINDHVSVNAGRSIRFRINFAHGLLQFFHVSHGY